MESERKELDMSQVSGAIGIFVGAEKIELFASFGMLLASDKNVEIFVESVEIGKLVSMKITTTKPIKVTVLPEKRSKPSQLAQTLTDAAVEEERLGVRLARLMAEDRALGFGYLLNADNYPFVKRAAWTKKEKMQAVLNEISIYRKSIRSKDFVLALTGNTILSLVCQEQNIPCLFLTSARSGDRCFWSDDGLMNSQRYQHSVERWGARIHTAGGLVVEPPYKAEVSSQVNLQAQSGGLRRTIRSLSRIIVMDSWRLISGQRKPHSYRSYAWVAPTIRRLVNLNWVKKRSFRPEDIRGERIIYFPLNLEPEISLLHFAPEFNNNAEAVSWLSKSAPADCLIVVKEHPAAYGVRSRRFHEQMYFMPNVIFSHPEQSSWDWVERSMAVATITGTVGQEAVELLRPVISFGKHSILHNLPTVFQVNTPDEVKTVLDQIAVGRVSRVECRQSKAILSQARQEISFPLASFHRKTTDMKTNEQDARIALDVLFTDLDFLKSSESPRNALSLSTIK